jgi:hypothetical protein
MTERFIERRFALLTHDGDIMYPYKKSSRKTGDYGFVLVKPGERDANGGGTYTSDLPTLIRRVVFDGWGVRALSESRRTSRSGNTVQIGKKTIRGYWLDPSLRYLVKEARLQPQPKPAIVIQPNWPLGGAGMPPSLAERALAKLSAITPGQFANAIAEVDAAMTPAQREMLIGHALASAHTLSMESIAALGGYDECGAGESQYGSLAAKVAEALGIVGLGNQIEVFCKEEQNADDQGRYQLTMRDNVIGALEILGFVPSSIGGPESAVDEDLAAALAEAPDLSKEAPTTRKALVDARLGQGTYRRKMLLWWDGACALTGCTVAAALVASHAVSWKHSSNAQRLDHFNGLPLLATLDRLFDSGLIGFTDSGRLVYSPLLTEADRTAVGLAAGMRLRKVDPRHLPYLEAHRNTYGLGGGDAEC